MLPTIAIVGRPNVGKSTLFNVLTRTRDALVANQSGLTRDRQFGRGLVGGRDYWVIDTGGLTDDDDHMAEHISSQVTQAIEESDSILFVVDGRHGLTAADEMIAHQLRMINKPTFLVVNKTDGLQNSIAMAEFYALGWGDAYPISSTHKHGISDLMDEVFEKLDWPEEEEIEQDDSIKVAIVGRPNVGKSTLVNRILGEERVIAYDQPGTTRDSIFVPFERNGQAYTLIDTAGVRRKAKVSETIEKFSVLKTLKAIEQANVVVLVLDAREGPTDQDSSLLGHVLEMGRSLVIAVNKWDGLESDEKDWIKVTLGRKLHFVDFAKIHFISALHGTGVGNLYKTIQQAYRAAFLEIGTSRLNQILQDAVEAHQPPSVRGRRIKLRFIHQGGSNPPKFVIHGNQVESLSPSYKRYITNCLRENFDFAGTPIKLELRQGENPFAGKRNELTPRQERKRRRMMKHIKKSK
ncbi:ribosome biogenesis GTPase Der [Candidatus Albibeggiatoa sp. nov. NOAA]|uniref:ribosome biogenesis GTPase Der n=1 Tax=Candidatus Albibeggiatoa sp. nov. NOAA TaxID=3162724 RepID=UPI0033023CE9|nr:ribosome biogenesis GTPase Der [Thiotrichaceae bacterium]